MKKSKPLSYYTLVILNTDTDKIIAVGSLFIEYKFIRNLGSAGHIEDIAVDASVQGKGLGKKIINALTLLSESLGAYKVILDCSEDNQGEKGSAVVCLSLELIIFTLSQLFTPSAGES
jgi:glucosamine-phosphate N-acetyltransferase